MTQVRQDLIAVRSLIAKPENWCKMANKLTDQKTGVVSYCIRGAMREVAPEWNRREPIQNAIIEALPLDYKSDGLIAVFNDSYQTYHRDVLAVLDKAIEVTP